MVAERLERLGATGLGQAGGKTGNLEAGDGLGICFKRGKNPIMLKHVRGINSN